MTKKVINLLYILLLFCSCSSKNEEQISSDQDRIKATTAITFKEFDPVDKKNTNDSLFY